MKNRTECSVQALALSVVTAAAAEPIGTACSARAAVWSGLIGAGAWMLLSVLVESVVRQSSVDSQPCRMLNAALLAGFGWELIQTVGQAQWICGQEFLSMALIGLLPLLLWVSGKMVPAGWDAAARVLWWGVLLSGGVYLLGMAGQMQWYPLAGSTSLQGWSRWMLPVYAEYFAVPRFCAADKSRWSHCLPLAAFGVQTAALLGKTMLFGTEGYPSLELLRAWGMGMFSRLDAWLLLVWLSCAIFRIGFLCTCIVQCGRQLIPSRMKGVQQP